MGRRPAACVAWGLAALLMLTCPQAVTLTLDAALWLVLSPDSAPVLGLLLALTLTYCATTRRRTIAWRGER